MEGKLPVVTVEMPDLIDHTSDAALALDESLRIVAWNRQAEQLLGYARSEVLGCCCWDILQGRTSNGQPLCTPACMACEFFAHGLPFGITEMVCRAKNGRDVTVSIGSLVLPGNVAGQSCLVLLFLRPVPQSPPLVASGAVLRVYTLGPFEVYVNERRLPCQTWRRKQALLLLKYLVHRRGSPVHREELLELLWPEEQVEKALKRLKVVVYFLRQQLGCGVEDEQRCLLVREGESYVLNAEKLWVDVAVFDQLIEQGARLVHQGATREALHCYKHAEALFRGDYLADEPYSEWCALERERIRERYLTLIEALTCLYEGLAQLEQSIVLYRKGLTLDPCRESLHRRLMQALWTAGRRDEALRQYRICQAALGQALGVEPMPETQQLYQQIATS